MYQKRNLKKSLDQRMGAEISPPNSMRTEQAPRQQVLQRSSVEQIPYPNEGGGGRVAFRLFSLVPPPPPPAQTPLSGAGVSQKWASGVFRVLLSALGCKGGSLTFLQMALGSTATYGGMTAVIDPVRHESRPRPLVWVWTILVVMMGL